MEKDKIKRERGNNWTFEMKEVLVYLVKPHIAIIDSRMNNTAAIKEKNDTWEDIRIGMAASGYNLTTKQLRDQWNRSKTAARSRVSKYKRWLTETDGSSPPKEPMEIDFHIANLSQLDFEEDTSIFDSDDIDISEGPINQNDVNQTAKIIVSNICKTENPSTSKAMTEKSSIPDTIAPIKENSVIDSTVKKPTFSRKKRRLTRSTITSEEILKKRIQQIDYESVQLKKILKLKEEVQQRKLQLVNLKIKYYEKKMQSEFN